uniref:Interferon regulatory factor 10 n=2 Tax=Xenopus tropicalis TaxID=8364 RepID=A0A803J954_XENTR
MEESRAQPMRLKEWLLEQIDSGRYPGLRWENPEKTVFRIPWKHAAKQDYRQQADAALFKVPVAFLCQSVCPLVCPFAPTLTPGTASFPPQAWAMYKGKFREGSGRADPSVWKTRLRCALNKSPDFQEVMENSQLDLTEPYKLYRILTPSEERSGEGDQEASPSPTKDQAQKPTVGGQCKSFMKEEESRAPGKEEPRYPTQEETEEPETGKVLQIQVRKRQGSPEPYGSKSWKSDRLCPPKATSCPTLGPSPWTAQHSYYRALDLSTRNEGLPSSSSSSSSDFWLHVRLYYQDKLVTEVTTKTAEGCRIVPWSAAPQQCGPCPPLSLEVVSLPSPQELPGHLTAEMGGLIQKLLWHLERGVLLWVAPEGVFIKRQCNARVYWSGQLAPHSDRPNKLEREKTCKVLDTEQFLQELQMYVTQGTPEPQYQIQLCFGEEYPDTSRVNPKILMMALVEPVFARELLLNAQRKVKKEPRTPDLQPPDASPTPPV